MTTLPRKHLFDIPEGIVYLDGNSLGPLPKTVAARLARVTTEEWGQSLIGGWNRHGWMDWPARLGDRIAPLIGAAPGSVMVGDTLSIKVYQALAAALEMRPDRRVVLSDSGNFPSDLYMAQGLLGSLGHSYELRVVDPGQVSDSIDSSIAAVMLTEVDYRTGRRHDMQAITDRARSAGAVTIWDLAHSAGAVELDLAGTGAEFAVGCTYKFLNGGPGAPAFIHVRPDLVDTVRPALSGWLGHRDPFDFSPEYRPAPDVARMRVGTPPVLQMAALEEALKLWEGIDMAEVQSAANHLADIFISEVSDSCPELRLVTPRDHAARGSQVSFAFEDGYAAMQALIDRGVIGDFRAPDIMRFGMTPLYLDETDVRQAAAILAEIVNDRLHDRPEYRVRAAVT